MIVAILLAIFNGEKYLAEQLNSIFEQSYQEWKLFVRDDGSTDGSLKIVREYQKKFPERLIVLETEISDQRGASANFFRMLSAIEADYYMFCDQDDIWLPKKIEISVGKMRNLAEKFGVGVPLLVFSDLIVVNHAQKIISKSFWKYQRLNPGVAKNWKKNIAQNVITGCTVLINHPAKLVSLPSPGFEIMHDRWIGANVAKYGHVDYIETPTVLYRQHENNVAGAIPFGTKYLLSKAKDVLLILHLFQSITRTIPDISLARLIWEKCKINLERLMQ